MTHYVVTKREPLAQFTPLDAQRLEHAFNYIGGVLKLADVKNGVLVTSHNRQNVEFAASPDYCVRTPEEHYLYSVR